MPRDLLCRPLSPQQKADWVARPGCRCAHFDALVQCSGRAVEVDPRIPEIRKKVEGFATTFPMPGFAVGPGSANGHVQVAPAIGLKPQSNGGASVAAA